MANHEITLGLCICALFLIHSEAVPPKTKIEVIQEKFEITKSTPEHVEAYGELVDGAINLAFHVKKAIPDDIEARFNVFSYNGKMYVPVEVPGLDPHMKFCDFVEKEKIFMPDLLAHMKPVPTVCPWGVGWWNLTAFKPNTDRIPPMAPAGKYKTELSFGIGEENYYTSVWEGTINKVAA